MDDFQWVNVQDPVRHMITSITKAVRTQSAGIRDLDRKMGFVATNDELHRTVSDAVSRCFSKQEASRLVESVNKKADIDAVAGIETNLMQVSHQLSRLNDVLQDQNSAIRDLNSRVTRLSEEMDDIRNPNYDQIFSYVDKQIHKMHQDFSDKLAVKADLREVERAIPLKVDEVYRTITQQVNSLHKDVARTATKDEVLTLLASKADGSEVKSLFADVSKCVSKQDMQQAISAQVRPVVSAISSLEKVIQIQEDRKHPPTPAPAQVHWSYDKIRSVVEDVLHTKYPHVNEAVNNTALDMALSQHKEYLMQEMSSHAESVRVETAASNREQIGALRKVYDGKLHELFSGLKESREGVSKVRSAVKDLAANVAKAVAKKADRSDFQKLLKESRTQRDAPTRGRSRSPLNGLSRGASRAKGNRDTYDDMFASQNHSQYEYPMEYTSEQEKRADHVSGSTVRVLTEELTALKRDLDKVSSAFVDNRSEVAKLRQDMLSYIEGLRDKITATKAQNATDNGTSYGSSFADWRMALGDLSLNIRREMSDKCGREEMHSAIGSELGVLDQRISKITGDVAGKASCDEVSKLENALVDLRSKVAGELTGGRWLWTNGKIAKDGWVPWDTEVQNAAPAVLIWRKGSTTITARIPGLYRICGAVFTSLPSALQICLNGEPILSLQPDTSDPSTASNSQALREERYVIRRMRHSVGEVTCLSIDEYVSLPADSQLTMRFHSAATAQAFFAIKKL